MNDEPDSRLIRVYRILLALLVQTLAAALGLYIMFEAIDAPAQKPWLYAAAIAMMGLPVAHNFESLVRWLSSILSEITQKARDAEQQPGPSRRRKGD